MYFSVQSAQGLYIRLCLILRLPIPATPIHLAHRDNPEVRTEGIVSVASNAEPTAACGPGQGGPLRECTHRSTGVGLPEAA